MDNTTIRNEIITYESIINFLEKNNTDNNVIKELKEKILLTCDMQLAMLESQEKDLKYQLETINRDMERYNYIIDKLK